MIRRRFLSTLKQSINNPSKATYLNLSNSSELICRNIMCQNLENTCLCRLAVIFETTHFPYLNSIDMENNNISYFPSFLLSLPTIKYINLRNNNISSISKLDLRSISDKPHLIVDIRENILNEETLNSIKSSNSFKI